jgi:hydroxyacylglutathione hydrolase
MLLTSQHPSMKIKTLTFNAFQVNTYILYDDTKECVIIDPACYEPHEEQALFDFIEKEGLQVKALLLTHGHVDHILGCQSVAEKYNLTPLMHNDALPFLEKSPEQGMMFGFDVRKPDIPDQFIKEGDIITFGHQKLQTILAPGHANGSLCFYNEPEKVLISGDVLFQGSIGRTDLPTGSYELLIGSIVNKLMKLPDDVIVFPGHGPDTTIGQERQYNPFLQDMAG